jgi:hypothetical protein
MLSVRIVTLRAGGYEVQMCANGRSENRLCRHHEEARRVFLELAKEAIRPELFSSRTDLEETFDRR